MKDCDDSIDLEFGLSQLSGNRPLLLKLLRSFSDEYQPLPEKLKEYQATGDITSYKKAVHTLKGVAGNLGLVSVHEQSKAIEQTLKDGHISPEELQQLSTALAHTHQRISLLHDDPNSDVAAPEPASSMAVARNKLKKNLQNNEFIPPNELSALIGQLGCTEKQATQLQDSINDLDYQAALFVLQQCD